MTQPLITWTTAPPPAEMWGTLSDVGSILPPMGLCYLAAVTRQMGLETAILDCYAQQLTCTTATQEILGRGTTILGITATTQEIDQAGALASRLKEENPAMIILIGGVHVTSCTLETLQRYAAFDYAVIGEGEKTIRALLPALLQGEDPACIKGIAYRDAGDIRICPPQDELVKMEDLPLPAFDLLPSLADHYKPAVTNYKRLPSMGLTTSRGCPGRCSFCDRGVFGNRLRMLPPARIMEIIHLLYSQHGIREIAFYDDTLMAIKDNFTALLSLLAKSDLELCWSCNARVNLVDPEILKRMKAAGCWQIAFGIESGEQSLLNRLKKGITLDQVEKAVRWSRDAGISVKGYYIIGLPGETEQSLRKTEDSALSLPLNDILLEYFTPFPGTELYDQLKADGVPLPDWCDMNTFELGYIPDGLSEKTLRSAYKRILRSFYLRPRVILDYLRRFSSPRKMLALGRTFLQFLREA